MMKHRHIPMRLASMLLVLALFAGLIAPANATGANSSGAELRVTRVDNQEVSANVLPKQLEEVTEIQPASTDRTRVSIVLEKESTLDAGFSTENIANNHAAMAYRAGLEQNQANMQAKIEKTTGEKLDVVWNLPWLPTRFPPMWSTVKSRKLKRCQASSVCTWKTGMTPL